MELYYRRGESTHKGKVYPARVETVVLLLPDVWSCVPTRIEWDGLQHNYKMKLEQILYPDQQQKNADGSGGSSGVADGAEHNQDEKALHKILSLVFSYDLILNFQHPYTIYHSLIFHLFIFVSFLSYKT